MISPCAHLMASPLHVNHTARPHKKPLPKNLTTIPRPREKWKITQSTRSRGFIFSLWQASTFIVSGGARPRLFIGRFEGQCAHRRTHPAEGVHELAVKDPTGRKAIFEVTEDGHRCHWEGDASGTSAYFAEGPTGVHVTAVSNAHDPALVGLLKAVLRHAHSKGKSMTWAPIDVLELFFEKAAAEEGFRLADDGKSAQPVFSHSAGTELAP